MIKNQIFDIAHNLRIALMSISCNGVEPLVGLLKDGRGLGMQHKGDCEETLCRSFEHRIIQQRDGTKPTLIHSIYIRFVVSNPSAEILRTTGQDIPIDRGDESTQEEVSEGKPVRGDNNTAYLERI